MVQKTAISFNVLTDRPDTVGEYIDIQRLFLQVSSLLKKHTHALNFPFTTWSTVFSKKTESETKVYYDALNTFMLNNHTIPPWIIHSLYKIVDPSDMLNMYGMGHGDLSNHKVCDINSDNEQIRTIYEWVSWLLDCPDEYQEIIMLLFDINNHWDAQFFNGRLWSDIALNENQMKRKNEILKMLEFINEISFHFKNNENTKLQETRNLCINIHSLIENHIPCSYGVFYCLQSFEEKKKNLFRRSMMNFLQKHSKSNKQSLPVWVIPIITSITKFQMSEEKLIEWLISGCDAPVYCDECTFSSGLIVPDFENPGKNSMCIDYCRHSVLWRSLLKFMFFVNSDIDILNDFSQDLETLQKLILNQEQKINSQHQTINSQHQTMEAALSLICKKNEEEHQLRLMNYNLQYYLNDANRQIDSLEYELHYAMNNINSNSYNPPITHNIHKKQTIKKHDNHNDTQKKEKKLKDVESKSKNQKNEIRKLNQKLSKLQSKNAEQATEFNILNNDFIELKNIFDSQKRKLNTLMDHCDESNDLIATLEQQISVLTKNNHDLEESKHYLEKRNHDMSENNQIIFKNNQEIFKASQDLFKINQELNERIRIIKGESNHNQNKESVSQIKFEEQCNITENESDEESSVITNFEEEKQILRDYLKTSEYFKDHEGEKIVPLWIMYAISNITGCLFKNESECLAWLENCDEKYCEIMNAIIESEKPKIYYMHSNRSKNSMIRMNVEETGFIGYDFDDSKDAVLILYFAVNKLTCSCPLIDTCEVCESFATVTGKKLKSCGQCFQTKYCSVECQSNDWENHEIQYH